MSLYIVTATIDATVDQVNPGINDGSGISLSILKAFFGGNKASLKRALMNFDLSGFPGLTSDITEVTLIIKQESGTSGGTAWFDRIQGHDATSPYAPNNTIAPDWVEANCSWGDFEAGKLWTSGGGDIDSTNRVTWTITTTNGVKRITGFTAMATDAIDNADRNSIMAVEGRLSNEADDGVGLGLSFSSSETLSSDPPKLEITYGGAATFVPRMVIF